MNREPQGIPTGGQFATGARTEADVELGFAQARDASAESQRRLSEQSARLIAAKLAAAYPGLTSFTYHEDEYTDYEPRLLRAHAGETSVDAQELEDVTYDDDVFAAFGELPAASAGNPPWAQWDESDQSWTVTITDIPGVKRDSGAVRAERVKSLLREKADLERRIARESAGVVAELVREKFPTAARVRLEWSSDLQVVTNVSQIRDRDGGYLGYIDDLPADDSRNAQDALANLSQDSTEHLTPSALRWADDPQDQWLAPDPDDRNRAVLNLDLL